eukprot:8288907-Pyramimonas_sp.AAC.1
MPLLCTCAHQLARGCPPTWSRALFRLSPPPGLSLAGEGCDPGGSSAVADDQILWRLSFVPEPEEGRENDGEPLDRFAVAAAPRGPSRLKQGALASDQRLRERQSRQRNEGVC